MTASKSSCFPLLVTNETFARSVGCHFTTASRYRNGKRLPGLVLFRRIVEVYDLDENDAYGAWTQGQEAFGRFLRDNVFFPKKKVA